MCDRAFCRVVIHQLVPLLDSSARKIGLDINKDTNIGLLMVISENYKIEKRDLYFT